MTKRRYIYALTGVLMLTMIVSCAKNQTPQYNTAVVSNDFAHAMAVFQTEVISLHKQGIMDDAGYATFSAAARSANTAGLNADKLIATGDWTGAIPLLNSALQVLQGIPPTSVGIKNPNSQLIYSASLNAAIATLEIVLSNTQTKAAAAAGVAK